VTIKYPNDQQLSAITKVVMLGETGMGIMWVYPKPTCGCSETVSRSPLSW
jgi:hypothetical protein